MTRKSPQSQVTGSLHGDDRRPPLTKTSTTIAMNKGTIEQRRDKTGTREEWLAARRELLKAEKRVNGAAATSLAGRQAGTARGCGSTKDTGSRRRRKRVPRDLFRDARSPSSPNSVFGPDYTGGIPVCRRCGMASNGGVVPSPNHDSRSARCPLAPLAKLQAYKATDGMGLPRASSLRRRLHSTSRVVHREQQRSETSTTTMARAHVSSRTNKSPRRGGAEAGTKIAESVGTDWPAYTRQAPGMSSFALEDGVSITPTRPTRAG